MDEPHRSASDLSAAMNAIVRDGLRPTVLAAAAMFTAFAVIDLLMERTGSLTLFWEAVATAALMGGLYVLMHSRPVPASLAHPVLAGICAIVSLNVLLRLVLWNSPENTAHVAIFMIAMGCLFLSLPWLIGALATTAAGWLAVALWVGPVSGWLSMSHLLMAGVVTSLLVHYVRVRSCRRFLLLRDEDARLRARLEATVAELHETQRFNQQVANSAPYVLYVFDLVEKRNTFINERIGDLLGYSVAEIQQRGAQLIGDLVHPADVRVLHDLWSRASRAGDADVLEGEYRVRHADGTWRWICTREVVFTRETDGSVRSILGSAHDVTSRRRSEQILNAVTAGTSSPFGPHYFGSVVRQLADALDVRAVLISHREAASGAIHGIACWNGSELREDFTYETAGTPCERVLAGEEVHLRDVFAGQGRLVSPLAAWECRSYCGIPLLDKSAAVIGHLALFDDKPMQQNAAELPALQVCIARLAAELERRRADFALRASEERLRAVFENAALGIALIEAEPPWRILESNRRLERLLGGEGADIAGTSFSELIYPEDCEETSGQFCRLVEADAGAFQTETRLLRRGAEPFWSQIDGTALRDAEGRPLLIVALVEDISERKRAEEELSFRTDFDRLVTQLSAQFVTADLSQVDDAVQSALERVGRFMGIDRASLCRFKGDPAAVSMTHEWCATGIESLMPAIQNIPVDRFPWFWRRMCHRQPILIPCVSALPPEAGALKEILEEHGSQSLIAVPLAAGPELWGFLGFSSRQTSRVWNDETVALLKIVGDLLLNSIERKQSEHARRESEARLRQILDNSTAVVFVKDLAGRYEFVNRAHENVFHVPNEQLKGKDDYSFLPTEIADQIRANDALVAAANEPRTVEEVVQHDDGPHTYIVVKFPLRDAEGRLYAICGIATDITDRKRADEQIRTLNRDIQHAARLSVMGEMAAGLAHELHQPLAVIVNYARGCVRRLQKGEMPRPVLVARLQEIADESIRAGRVIDKIRSFLQKREHERKPVELNPIVEDALQMARFDRRQMHVQVEFRAGSDLPTVVADSVQITQVLLNLILNAVQAMATRDIGERKLTVTTRRRDEQLVEVSVADTGPGLSPEVQARIFEQFFTTKSEGLGMGLAISRSIVQAHGGTLWYTTEPGAGTTFTFTLPITSKLLERAVHEMSRTASSEGELAASIQVDENGDSPPG